MAKCSFCSQELPRGSGTLFVRKDGSILYFCKSKCMRNLLDLGRKPSKYKWAAKGAKIVAAEKAQKKKKE